MCNFANDSTGFSRGFPGVRPHLLTLNSNFTIPFYREILLFLGVCSVSKRSCERILRKGNGSAITIVVGGAAESLSAHPGTADLTLRKRCVVCSERIDWGRVANVFLDWGSSSSRLGKGMSSTPFCYQLRIDATLHSADLVPVFSFGENDVRPLARPWPVDMHRTDISDLRANAKRKGHNAIQNSEEVSKCLWIHTSIVPRARDTQL